MDALRDSRLLSHPALRARRTRCEVALHLQAGGFIQAAKWIVGQFFPQPRL